MADIVNQLSCRSCGYDLAGLESPRCPECGADVPTQTPPNHRAAQEHAAANGLKCRHCKRALADMIDGVCACGAKYQLASIRPLRRSGAQMSLVDGVTVIAAIIGCAIALLAFIFTGTARNSDPKWGAVILGCIPPAGMLIAVASRRAFARFQSEVRSMINWFFIVISAVCLIGAVVILT